VAYFKVPSRNLRGPTEHRFAPVPNIPFRLSVPARIFMRSVLYRDRLQRSPQPKYRGADKSSALPGRKQATATKFWLLQATQKQFRRLSVQPGLRDSNDRFGRKVATFQLFFQSGRAKDLSAPP